MAVVAEQQGCAVATEEVPKLLGPPGGVTPVAAHQGGGDGALRATGEDDATVEVGGVDRRRLAISKQGGRGQPRPSLGKGAGGGPERGRPLRWGQGGTAAAGRNRGRGAAADSGGDGAVEAGQPQPWLPFDPGKLSGTDRPGELAVAAAMAGEEAQAVATVEVELDADDGADPGRSGRFHEADGSVQAVAVAQPQCVDPQRGGGGHQGAR